MTISTSPSEDLAIKIDEDALFELGVDLFQGEWDKENSKQILLLDGVGISPLLQQTYEAPNIQVLVRGSKTESAREVFATAKTLYDYIVKLPQHVDCNGVCYAGFTVDTPLQHLGKDDNNRHVYTMSFQTYRNFE